MGEAGFPPIIPWTRHDKRLFDYAPAGDITSATWGRRAGSWPVGSISS